jgi:APA family basic amino acid/polyamine antiporter
MILCFAYGGFDIVSSLADETKEPKITIPFSMNATVLVCMVFYILISISMSGMAKFYEFPGETAMPLAFESVGAYWMSYIILIAGFFGISAVTFNCVMVCFFLFYDYQFV